MRPFKNKTKQNKTAYVYFWIPLFVYQRPVHCRPKVDRRIISLGPESFKAIAVGDLNLYFKVIVSLRETDRQTERDRDRETENKENTE